MLPHYNALSARRRGPNQKQNRCKKWFHSFLQSCFFFNSGIRGLLHSVDQLVRLESSFGVFDLGDNAISEKEMNSEMQFQDGTRRLFQYLPFGRCHTEKTMLQTARKLVCP
jgi:hypothetical protein